MKTTAWLSFLLIGLIISHGVLAEMQKQNNAEPDSFCPKISDIKKNNVTQKWRAQTMDGTWKSYHASFASNLTKFIGAQWNGQGIGQVTCIYDAQQRYSEKGSVVIQPALPVMLVFHTLTFEPNGSKWVRVQGVRNCYAEDQKNCPFKIHIQKQAGDIYQEAESLKSSDGDQLKPVDY